MEQLAYAFEQLAGIVVLGALTVLDRAAGL